MPFTLSHTAAVLPLLKARRMSATGLIIGTMAPDFEYFFRLDVLGIYGHTFPGIFYFDLPVIIFLAFVFHNVAKKNLIDQLPLFLQQRFQQTREFNFNEFFRGNVVPFVISGIIGTITHIVWDGFTHKRQIFVEALPGIYEGRSVPFMGMTWPLWYALQQISTVVGLAVVIVYVLRMKPVHGSFNRPHIIYWVLLAVFIAAVTITRMQFHVPNEYYVVIVIAMVSAFCLGITILGLVPFRRREILK
jgi:hypothetical protein